MNEQGWLSGADPTAMLAHVQDKVSDRRLRLFACACHRLSGHPLHADDPAPYGAEGEKVRDADVMALAQAWARGNLSDGALTHALKAALLRCIAGDPFRPASARQTCPGCGGGGRVGPCGLTDYFRACWTCGRPGDHTGTGWVAAAWLTPAVTGMAARVYAENDFSPAALGVLADGLEEAGCEDEGVLRHLRGWERCPCLGVPCCGLSADPDPRWRQAHTCAVCDGVGWVPAGPPCPACDGRGWHPGDVGCGACGATTPGTVGTGRLPAVHAKGCWVLDLVLGRE